MSRPEHSWNAPSTSVASVRSPVAPLGGLPATAAGARNRLTWKLYVRARNTLGTAALHAERSIAIAIDAEDNELEWLCGSHPDLDDELTLVGHPRGIQGVVGADEECLRLVVTLEGAGGIKAPQEAVQHHLDVGAKRSIVRLEDEELHLSIEHAHEHRHQPADAQLAVGGIVAQGPGGRQPDPVPFLQIDIDRRLVQPVVVGGRHGLDNVDHPLSELVGRTEGD